MDNHKALQMKQEIRAVAAFLTLKIWKVLFAILLIISAFYVQYLGLAESPVYMLLLLLLLPPIIRHILNDLNHRYEHIVQPLGIKEIPFVLNMIKRKYQYQRLSHMSNSISFIFMLILLFLWQFNLNTVLYPTPFLMYLPKAMILVSLLIRFLGGLVIRWKITYDLSHSK